MKKFMKYLLSIIAVFSLSIILPSCTETGSTNSTEENIDPIEEKEPSIEILDEDPLTLEINTKQALSYTSNNIEGAITFESSKPTVASIDEEGIITAKSIGTTTITIYSDEISDSIEVMVIDSSIKIESWGINSSSNKLNVGETATIEGWIYDVQYKYLVDQITFEMTTSEDIATLEGNLLIAKSPGEVEILGKFLTKTSEPIYIEVVDPSASSEPEDPIDPVGEDVTISLSVDKTMVGIGEIFTFTIDVIPEEYYDRTRIYVVSGYDNVRSNSGSKTEYYFYGMSGVDGGTTIFTAKCTDNEGVTHYSNQIAVSWGASGEAPDSITITPEYEVFAVGETITIDIDTNPDGANKQIVFECLNDEDAFEFSYGEATALKAGTFEIQGDILGVKSNIVELTVVEEDPYADIDIEEFYDNYEIADSETDAYLRTKHNLMSGDITPQDQYPTVVSEQEQPKEGDFLIHNSSKLYSEDGDTYYVLNSEGEIAKEIYKVGAYVSLEDVAAYVYAFGDVPINYDIEADSPKESVWGEYLRWNHKQFTGDVEQYPYEPVLPRIYGCGGDLIYYEIDIGTTGTDSNPDYPDRIYNDGTTITRGAARIVYSRYYADTNELITDLDDRYVFYTYNHYNDFQEYLNYENGWGERFGNDTAGNDPDEYDPNNPPTDYIETVRIDLSTYKYLNRLSIYQIDITEQITKKRKA